MQFITMNTPTFEDCRKLSKEDTNGTRQETGEGRDKTTSIVSDYTTVTGSSRRAQTAAINIKNVAVVIVVVPFHETGSLSHYLIRTEGIDDNVSRILNVGKYPSDGPGFIVETHLIAMPPYPLKS